MATGALLQLQSRNDFDDLLFSDDIKMSEFAYNYKKITNFSEIPYTFYPTSKVSWGDKIVFKINKVGDLLMNMYLTLELPEIKIDNIIGVDPSELGVSSKYRVKWQDYIGYAIIESAILRIGGKVIQEMTGEYMMCHTDLYDNTWANMKLCGHDGDLIIPQLKIFKQFIYVPLRFFNCNNYNSGIPVNALRYQEIEVEIKLRQWEDIYLILYQLIDVKDAVDRTKDDPNSYKYAHTKKSIPKADFNNCRLDCNFIYLDSFEREYFLNNKLSLLITQVQSLEQTLQSKDTVFLNFTNPVKELYFLVSKNEIRNLGELYNYSGKPEFIPFDDNGDPITEFTKSLWVQIPEKHVLEEASLQFNNVDRVPFKDYKYWYAVQNYETFKSRPMHYIYLYSFGLSNKRLNVGSCNFSEFESVKLNIRLAGSDIRRFSLIDTDYTIELGPEDSTRVAVYGISYNFFDIEDGMCELRYNM